MYLLTEHCIGLGEYLFFLDILYLLNAELWVLGLSKFVFLSSASLKENVYL